MTRVVSDENGMARGFPYHDGELYGLLVDPKNASVHLALRDVTGVERVLSLRGVKAMDLSEFREGNIVLDICIFPPARAADNPELWKKIEERLYLTRATFPSEGLVVWLLSSYGAEIIAVCSDVEISNSGAQLVLTAP